jgi:ABC-type molybdate transport system substrate-binding protein
MLTRYRRLANVLAGLALLVSVPAQSATVLVAVASNFNETFVALSKDFETNTGHVVKHSAAATGVLAAGAGASSFLPQAPSAKAAIATGKKYLFIMEISEKVGRK